MPRSLAGYLLAGFFSLFFTQPLFSKFEWVPVAKLELLGGQFFFEGKETSFSGNGDWFFAPGMKLSDRFLLVPTFTGKYRRMREVKELIGGGFLTSETLENSFILKGTYMMTDLWKMKLKGSFKNQLLVESVSEKLGKGLFDNNKVGFGLEVERSGSILSSLRISFDPYAIRFPNYKTLASGSQFGNEIKSGENTLDFDSHDIAVAGNIKLPAGVLLSATLLGSYRIFTEQKVVETSGIFTDRKRKDFLGYTTLSISYRMADWKLLKLQSLIGVDLSFSLLDSIQNNYDASRTKFNPNYYDYIETHVSPRVAGRFFEKLDCAVAYDFSRRNYNQREVQDSSGNYQSGTIVLDSHSISSSFKYALPYGLGIVVRGTHRLSTSNMKYEQTYRYNYSSQHYFAGISWEY